MASNSVPQRDSDGIIERAQGELLAARRTWRYAHDLAQEFAAIGEDARADYWAMVRDIAYERYEETCVYVARLRKLTRENEHTPFGHAADYRGFLGCNQCAADREAVELIRWRTQAGLTQARLASLLGVQEVAVGRWERGQRAMPPFLALALVGLETVRPELPVSPLRLKLSERT